MGSHEERLEKFNTATLRPSLINFVPIRGVCKALGGRSYSSVDNDVIAGWLPPWVKFGGKLKTLPDYEIDVVIAARMDGKSNEEIKILVAAMVKARGALFESLTSEYSAAA